MDLFGTLEGQRTEHVEWGQRAIRDGSTLLGPKGTVRSAVSEEQARGYAGAHYPGGPVFFEPVRRVIVTYTWPWETPPAAGDPP